MSLSPLGMYILPCLPPVLDSTEISLLIILAYYLSMLSESLNEVIPDGGDIHSLIPTPWHQLYSYLLSYMLSSIITQKHNFIHKRHFLEEAFSGSFGYFTWLQIYFLVVSVKYQVAKKTKEMTFHKHLLCSKHSNHIETQERISLFSFLFQLPPKTTKL